MELNRKLKMGMVGGGKDAFIGAVHRRAALMDGKVELVAGETALEVRRSLGRELIVRGARRVISDRRGRELGVYVSASRALASGDRGCGGGSLL